MEYLLTPFESDHFELFQLTDGVWAAIAREGGSAVSNAGIIDLGGRTLVFDTMLTPQAARDLRAAAVQFTGREPELVVNSHYHNDHIWGNQVFAPETLFVSTTRTREAMQTYGPDEIGWAQDVSTPRLQAAQQQYAQAPDEETRQEAQRWIGYFGGLVEALPSLSVRFPDMTFDGRLALHGSARSVELIPFEDSHTVSDLILHIPGSGIVFAADLLFVRSHPYLAECNLGALRRSLESIAAMSPSVLVPGHGPLGTLRDITSNLDYLSMVTARAQALVAQGDTSEERIARETPPAPFADWALARFFSDNLEALCADLMGGAGSG